MTKLREEQKNELIRQERERRRIARLRQVRQQTATNAKIVREVVSEKKAIVLEEIRNKLHEQVDGLEASKQKKRKTMTPRSAKKKSSRRREMTENDLSLAQQRNAEAMRRLRDSKHQALREREERLAKRKEAAEKANAIMRGVQVL